MNTSKKNNTIFGHQPVLEALRSNRQIDKLLLKKGLPGDARKELMDLAQEKGVLIQNVPVEKLDRLSRGGNHQGVAAEMALIPYIDLEDLLISLQDRGMDPFFIMLDGVTDVRNFGAIVRSAECLGADGIIIPKQGAAKVNADAMKVSAGALNHFPVCRVENMIDTVYLLKNYEVQVAVATEKSEDILHQQDVSGPICIVMGSEEKGVSSRIQKMADLRLKIPMHGKVSSLNVSVSAGIFLMEVRRQREINS